MPPLLLTAISGVCLLMTAVAVVLAVHVLRLKREVAQGYQVAREAARRDPLTYLPNRLALEERLPAILQGAGERSESVALLFVDVDRFKTINDTLGHRTGDELLRHVAERFNQRHFGAFSIFRNGGDEFVVVLDRIRHKRAIAAAAMDVLAVFRDPFRIEGRELHVTASVGASVYPKNAQTAHDLMAYADSAMYRAKEAGRNNAKFYDGTMHALALERMALEQDLRSAVSRNELELEYQQVVDLQTGAVSGAEALIRWNHPRLGRLNPQAFIGVAEETGSITGISRFVLREACEKAARMRRSLVPNFRIAVNLSPRDFYEPDLPNIILRILHTTGLDASALDIEVTENIVVNDTALATLERVHRLGVGIALDDFGMGYSSLAYIKRLPLTAVKIDRTFIKNILQDASDQGIAKAVGTLAQAIGVRIIAEGVETQAQRQFLRSLKFDYAQGFLFGHPVSWDEFEASIPRDGSAPVIALHGT